MKQEETKALLQEGAIRTVAREGLEKASTKLIAYEANVNEVFIFRYYGGKDNLLDETFRALDEQIVQDIVRCVRQMSLSARPLNEKLSEVISSIWNNLMAHRYEVLFYVRYYYSAAFLRAANLQHLATTRELVDILTPHTHGETAARTVVMSVMDGLLNMAMQVELGNVIDTETTAHSMGYVFSGLAMSIINAHSLPQLATPPAAAVSEAI